MVDATYRSAPFAPPSDLVIGNFSVGAGGWTTQNDYPRYVADVNGDGYNDLVGYGYDGVYVSFGSARGTFSTPTLMVNSYGLGDGWHGNNIEPRFISDLDGDGIADILISDNEGVLVRPGTPDGKFYAANYGLPSYAFGDQNFAQRQGWTTQDQFPRTLGDINGDGARDLIGFGYEGTWVALNGKFSTPGFNTPRLRLDDFGVDQGWISDDLFHRAVADVNGDGADDIVGFGYAGTLVALADGRGGFLSPTLALDDFGRDQGWTSQNALPRQLADVDGDGRADIVGFGIAGVYVAYGRANGSFSSPTFVLDDFNAAHGWTSNDVYPRTLADIDDDGRIDIVGFGIAGVLVGHNDGGLFA